MRITRNAIDESKRDAGRKKASNHHSKEHQEASQDPARSKRSVARRKGDGGSRRAQEDAKPCEVPHVAGETRPRCGEARQDSSKRVLVIC